MNSPSGMSTVTPHLTCRNAAAAITFYQSAFGATELSRLPAPDGRLMHALLRIGDACVMLVDEFEERGLYSPHLLQGSPVTLHLYVDDVDTAMARAVAAGATITMPADDMFWGDRYGRLIDPFGHQWSIATHVHDLTPEQIAAAGTHPGGDD